MDGNENALEASAASRRKSSQSGSRAPRASVGEGPGVITNESMDTNRRIAVEREALIQARQRELDVIVDKHDDLVRTLSMIAQCHGLNYHAGS